MIMTDMAALAELIARVQVGTRVKVTNHDYAKANGERVVDRVSASLYGTGRAGYTSRRVGTAGGPLTTYYLWPTEAEDFEVHGSELRIFNPLHAYVNGGRAIVLTLAFELPPEPEHTCGPGINYGCDVPECDGDTD